ncbi:MAG TPA: ribose-phosphate pyrophosphokinase [Erysipelotrichaceae bacterium]|jgi:ribose-phosphate pyrophosphokinase|nr:ribose-phosphate pyrophosphokinase [Bacillota bacterium]NLP22267.1 ribose-phosphate pyrophosphokinase [Erysipelotrichaceae bacterium]HCY07250.1 ribose-phosphate pyrophosphokinase [Erysipelotrichaceae bacterium]
MNNETVIFALTSNVDLANEICKFLNLPLGNVEIYHFADGEILVEPHETVRGRKVYIIQSTCSPVTERLMEVLVCVDACKRASAGEINLVIPYFGYARQDRKSKPRQPITAKLVADLLQTAGANRIITIDLHASQIQGFFDIPIDDLTAVPMLGQYFKTMGFDPNDIVVVSPDHGGTTRARNLANKLDAPIAIIDKRRPRPNVVEAHNIIGDIEDKICIVVDDICDTGGSLVAACEMLNDKGAREIYVAVTHGVFSNCAITTIENSPIKQMIITNTIPLSEEQKNETTKIKQLSVGYMLAKTIEAIQYNNSVSHVYDLFGN